MLEGRWDAVESVLEDVGVTGKDDIRVRSLLLYSLFLHSEPI